MSDDPLEAATKGATRAVLEYTEEKLKALVSRLANHDLAFIQSKDNIDLVKKERQSSEYAVLCQFLPKNWLRIVVQMGLALRDLERNKGRTSNLRGVIREKFGDQGLHVAELTQIGIVTQLLARLTTMYRNPVDTTKKLSEFLEHADDMVIFIQARDGREALSKANLIKLRIESPSSSHIMIMFGRASARPVVKRIIGYLSEDDRHYPIEIQEQGDQITVFVFTPELKARVSHWSDVFDNNR